MLATPRRADQGPPSAIRMKGTDMRSNLAGVVALGLVLAGCATATPYQPYRPHSAGGIHGGYSEERVAADEFRVRFHGNSMTSRERVETYMLYRAAELTVANGYDWFMAVDRNMEHTVRTVVRPDPFYRPILGPLYPYWQPEWRYYQPGRGWGYWPDATGQIDVRQIESFEATADVRMSKGAAPGNEPRAMDARRVIANLGPAIERPNSTATGSKS